MEPNKKPLRIALVAPYPAQMVLPPERIKPAYRNRPVHPAPWVRSLTTALRKREDVEFRVFTHSRAVNSVVDGEENGVPFTVIPQYEPGRVDCWHLHLPARLQFRLYLNRYRPDLVHGFGTESSYGLIASEQRAPGVVFIQGIQTELARFYQHYSKITKWLRIQLERRVIRRSSGLIAETKFAEAWVRRMNPRVEVVVIPHAVNPEFFEVESDYSCNDCLCVGTLNHHKAVDTAIRAVAAARVPDWRLIIIGDGPLRSPLKQLARDLGVAHRVEFCGYRSRSQIIERMKTARALVILSRMDTSPNILTEAHAAGLPVVGSRAGGIPDMIEEGRDGFLVDVDDHLAAAEKLDLLCSDVELCRRLGKAGRDKVRWLNDPDRIADLHVQFYHHIVERYKYRT